jgi:hypothetical protein
MAPKKRSKVDLSHLRALIQLEKEPVPLTNKDVKAMLIPSSYKSYEYIMALSTKSHSADGFCAGDEVLGAEDVYGV